MLRKVLCSSSRSVTPWFIRLSGVRRAKRLVGDCASARHTTHEAGMAIWQAIGGHGAAALLAAVDDSDSGSRGRQQLRVLTHCNTGSLATASYGTALGIVRSLQEQGRLERVFCTETRPFNQGLPNVLLQILLLARHGSWDLRRRSDSRRSETSSCCASCRSSVDQRLWHDCRVEADSIRAGA